MEKQPWTVWTSCAERLNCSSVLVQASLSCTPTPYTYPVIQTAASPLCQHLTDRNLQPEILSLQLWIGSRFILGTQVNPYKFSSVCKVRVRLSPELSLRFRQDFPKNRRFLRDGGLFRVFAPGTPCFVRSKEEPGGEERKRNPAQTCRGGFGTSRHP
ncbi:hypothetical protein FQA47_024209 [Oryzias melastigma]|uniref:Uncharacterized protein n=1 Tax=Oryzias melastigma TaxID=30732 RepID=A0A834CBX3_ORYME|nr:hypothetical protein FQA47_024209 [Oryzias melastigma]